MQLSPLPTATHFWVLPECSRCPHTHHLHTATCTSNKSNGIRIQYSSHWVLSSRTHFNANLLCISASWHITSSSTTAAVLRVWKTLSLLTCTLGHLLSLFPGYCPSAVFRLSHLLTQELTTSHLLCVPTPVPMNWRESNLAYVPWREGCWKDPVSSSWAQDPEQRAAASGSPQLPAEGMLAEAM